MTEITYWLIRYVPNVARGEFQNIGVVCGSDDGDWAVAFDWRQLYRESMPRDVREWAQWLSDEVNADARLTYDHEFTRAWVEGIRQRQANAIQLSPPQPTVASSARDAVQLLYPVLVEREANRRRSRMTRRYLRAAVRDAYRMSALHENSDYFMRPSIRLGTMAGDFDVIQVNESRPVLRSSWAFDLLTTDSLYRDINAWNYGITRLRADGATFVHHGQRRPINRDAVVTAVIDAPTDPSSEASQLYETVLEAWEREHVEVLTLDQLEERLPTAAW